MIINDNHLLTIVKDNPLLMIVNDDPLVIVFNDRLRPLTATLLNNDFTSYIATKTCNLNPIIVVQTNLYKKEVTYLSSYILFT